MTAHVDACLRARVWEQVCRHVDGVAIGSTMAALDAHGVLAALDRRSVSVEWLAARLGANAGYMHVAMRLLADQGWVVRRASPTGDATVEPTPFGRAAFALAGAYGVVPAMLDVGQRIDDLLFGDGDGDGHECGLARLRDLSRGEWGLDRRARPVTVRLQVQQQLDGGLVAPICAALARRGVLTASTPPTLDLAALGGRAAALVLAFEILGGQDWATVEGQRARLTPAGRIAAALARQYWYPVCYLATFARVPELLFASPPPGAGRTPSGAEAHVDRELDIAFSGAVFDAACRTPFLEIALPIFDAELARQPAAVVDTGCGDGSLLLALYAAICERTERGRRRDERPLVMVGVEPSTVARRRTAARLRAKGVPHVVLDGDVSDPAAVAGALRAARIDPLDALHVSKSVIHNRAPRHAGAPAGAGWPPSEAAHAADDGSSITPAEVVTDLVDHLRGWRALVARHGLLTIEAHAARPAETARLLGRSIGTAFDATHGYSNQLPVEPEVFAAAARAAGLRSASHRELGVRGAPLTLDHFVVSR